MVGDPPPPPSPSIGATARPTSPRSSTSASADLDELLLTAPQPSTSTRRSFTNDVKQRCWEKAERVLGRDPERWRRDAVGNVVFRLYVGCKGCLCHDYDHIVPYSEGGRSTLENCQILQATVNRSKGNKTGTSKFELAQKSAYGSVSESDMDRLEDLGYGDIRRAPDPVPAAVPPPAPAAQAVLSQILSVVTDIKLSQQRLEENQQRLEENQQRLEKAQTDTNDSTAALADQVHSLKQAFATQARYRHHRRLKILLHKRQD